ncbi:MAG: 2Fe-2S iron-sulfur cluster binding domain-containing protein [Spirochaetia bacterium]|nr:2Fe-2S iron-sulfur cluster binding domain-containing protein [Spirochaetia bacterium]MCF7941540.1 2Fe-2S iron-sulfur cluster binding domain-containing protein [Spirochaetia bacterium]
MSTITFRLNEKNISLEADPASRLLDLLREDLGLSAVKEGCGEGECGACSVLKDGVLVNSCMVPVGTIEHCSIETLEGLRETDEGRCIIEAFADTGAVQCGFCTPGMVMASIALLRSNARPTLEEIKVALSGNLCRCTGYDMIIKGVQLAAERGDGIW